MPVGREHCFHYCNYITPVLLLCDLRTVRRGSLVTTYVIYTYTDRCWREELDTGEKHRTSLFPVLL